MKSEQGSTYRPFKDLGKLLEVDSSAPKPDTERTRAVPTPVTAGSGNDRDLFMEAMKDVAPMVHEHIIVSEKDGPPTRLSPENPDAEALMQLEALVRNGDGFVVSHTSEYMEGIGYGASPHVARRLHRGDFSIQGHLDLHGCVVEEARAALEKFLKDALEGNKRAVLIVHGRGRSSRDRPVLKTKVKEWLTSGPWRKWVIAFASARPCDGGAGATYVLLRRRPATKRDKRKPGGVCI